MTSQDSNHRKSRKMAFQLIGGAIAGGLATLAALTALDGRGLDTNDMSQMFAFMVGLIFVVIGISMAVGISIPRAGAHMLNVEDADELREQRKSLWSGTLMFAFMGVALIVLSLSGPGPQPLLPRSAAAVTVGACLVSMVARNSYDEMTAAVSREAGSGSFYAVLIIATVWATLAHLGMAEWISPLGLLAGLCALMFVAAFWATARRGLLRPR